MLKKLFRVVVVSALGLLCVVARAQDKPNQATITAAKGATVVTLADGTSVPAVVGLKIGEGAEIVTGKDAQVSLETHPGIVAVVSAGSRVEVEKLSVSANGTRNALLNLKSGGIASSLDPAMKDHNNYGVRTAKGVAMARGTTLTVSVNGSNYTVMVLSGTVTVNWGNGRSVSITGNTAQAVTSNGGTPVSLASALSSGGSTALRDALSAAAAAVATVATTATQVTSVIDTIATAAGTSSAAAATVASATAAATGAAVTNTTLVAAAGNGGTTSVASTISTAAVTAATAAGNGSAAQLIVTSAVNAVVNAVPGTNVNAVATALSTASNNVSGNTQINAGQVTAGVNAAQNPATSQGKPPGGGNENDDGKGKDGDKGKGGDDGHGTTTPITPIDPSITVSPSGG
jgi:hypothetical protein